MKPNKLMLAGSIIAVWTGTVALAGPPHFEGFESAAFSPGGPLPTPISSPNWNRYNSGLTRVASGTGGITSYAGGFHAVLDSTALPAPPNAFSGAFTRLGGYTNAFGAGFRTSLAVYLDVNDPRVAADTYGFDLSCAANNQSGSHRRDFVFHAAGKLGGMTNRILIGGSNNSNFTRRTDLASINHYVVSSSGWYVFEWIFRNNAGVLAVDLNLRDAGNALLWTETRSDPTDLIATIIGGNRYLWFTFLEVDQLAIDNTTLSAYNTLSLEIISPKSCYKAGDQICLGVWMRNLTQNVTGWQAFLQFDNAILTYQTAASSYTNSPFPVHIQSIPGSQVAPGQINLDGSDNPGGVGTGADALLATLCFTVNAGNNGSTTSISFRTVPVFNSELSFQGTPLPTLLLNSATFGIDQAAPMITCPDPFTVSCLSGVPAPATNLAQFLVLPGAAVNDLPAGCGNVIVQHVSDSSSGNCQLGPVTITRTYRAIDTAGNIASCNQSIIVAQDNTPPDVDEVPPTKFVECDDEVPAPYPNLAAAIADGLIVTDTCNMTLSLVNTFDQGSCPRIIVRIYRVTDECGNFKDWKDVIIVDDVTAPTIVGSGAAYTADPNCQATAVLTATVNDNCGVTPADVNVAVSTGGMAVFGAPMIVKTPVTPEQVQVTVTVLVSDLASCPATVTALITAADACANPATPLSITATVNDASAPTIACSVVGGPVDASCQRNVTFSATIDDNCCVNAAAVSVSVNGTGPAIFGVPVINTVQVNAKQVQVNGSVMVSALTGCPANVDVTINATDCCTNGAMTCQQSAAVTDATVPMITCPPNINVFADAGGCTASGVVVGSPVVVDNCDGSPGVAGVRSDAQPLSAPYPAGVTTITWTAVDDCSNTSSCMQTVTVAAKNLVVANLQLAGVNLGMSSVTRCIRFIPRNGTNCGASVHVPVVFTGSPAAGSVTMSQLQIDCGPWTSICAKDEQHTLSDSAGLAAGGSGPVVWNATGTLVLRGGDNDNDNDVDINDVTLLLVQFAQTFPPNSPTCPWNGARNADFSLNSVVGSEDYLFLSANWQQFATCCGGAGWPLTGGDPEPGEQAFAADTPPGGGANSVSLSIPASKLPPTEARRADLNRDGVVDVSDVELFEARHGLDGSLSAALRIVAEAQNGK